MTAADNRVVLRGHSGVKDKQGVSVFTPAGKYQDSQLDTFPGNTRIAFNGS